MSIITSPMLLGADTGGAYQISRSLRFNASDSAYLSRVFSSAGNRKTWTWAGWVKRGKLADSYIWGNNSTTAGIYFSFVSDKLNIGDYTGGTGYVFRLNTASVYRDPSAWMHIVFTLDTTQATASNRARLYINGSEVAGGQLSTATYPTQNYNGYVNQAVQHNIGAITAAEGSKLDGYLAEVHFIDGQALTPSSFTETDATTGQLIPKAYTGSYGTNGFKLNFSDNSTVAALGTDTSGNGNTWTVNNLSVTAGSGNDSLVDTPTSYGTDTGAGGEVRGNYATLNPLFTGGIIATTRTQTISNGNLYAAATANSEIAGTIAVSSGKWYYEIQVEYSPSTDGMGVGFVNLTTRQEAIYRNSGGTPVFRFGGTETTYGASYATGDIMGIALDIDNTSITFYKNGVSQGVAKSNLPAGAYAPYIFTRASSSDTRCFANFGQRAFAYTAPSGFKALCDTNLPTPVVAKPNTVMDVALWTGNGSARSITGLAFNPDFVWIKGRSGATDHALYDAVRGVQKDLVSNSTAAETTQTQGLTAFNSDGFSLGTLAKVNTSSATYAGWAWDAGTSTVTNTAGSITSQVRANASAGFSVVTYTGTLSSAPGTAPTVGHGLGVKPALIISKSRSNSEPWYVNHSYNYNNYLRLNTTAAEQDISANGGGTEADPTSTVFSTYYINGSNTSGTTYVAYCFAPVSGYSAMGSYVGNGSSDGPFVYTGFRPRYVLAKAASGTDVGSDGFWNIADTARAPYNWVGPRLVAQSSAAEDLGSTQWLDILSNGFKMRIGGTSNNNSGTTYIYCAWAESPFQYARAR